MLINHKVAISILIIKTILIFRFTHRKIFYYYLLKVRKIILSLFLIPL